MGKGGDRGRPWPGQAHVSFNSTATFFKSKKLGLTKCLLSNAPRLKIILRLY